MDAKTPAIETTAPANTVYFYGECPVSLAAIRLQKRLMGSVGQCELMWVDVCQEPEHLKALDLSKDALRERLAVTDGVGCVHQGALALALLLDHTRGLTWLARPLRWSPVRRLVDRGYARLALRLFAWNVRHKRWPPSRAAQRGLTGRAMPASAEQMAQLAETPKFHAAVLGDYRKGYSLSVGPHPESPKTPAIVVQVEGTVGVEQRQLSFDGLVVPVVIRGGFVPPAAL